MSCKLPEPECSWRDWHVPLICQELTLDEILRSAEQCQAGETDIPLIIQLVENPKFDLPWIRLFEGAVNLFDHDCIHALLGRGMLPKDEAFVIGFTMGSSNRTGSFEQNLFAFIAKYLYPGPYKFSDDDVQIFKDAVHLGYVSDCQSLSEVNYKDYLHLSVKEARLRLGIEANLLSAYYAIEKKRYPDAKESQRLF